MQDVVDTQQAITLEENLAIGHIEQALVSKLLKLVTPAIHNIDTKLPIEVGAVHPAQFHLKDELTDHALLFRRAEAPLGRHLAGFDGFGIIINLGEILIMNSSRM